jgi:hypothetical protein
MNTFKDLSSFKSNLCATLNSSAVARHAIAIQLQQRTTRLMNNLKLRKESHEEKNLFG